jgi:tetratricopeptide (TPR) repeat protein
MHLILIFPSRKKNAVCNSLSGVRKVFIICVNCRAQQTDPNDHLAEYYLALQFAYGCQVGEAMSHVKMALNLRAEHVPSLHLLILLLSAQKQYAEALHLVAAALEEYPDNLNLLYVKAHIELQSQGGEVRFILLFVRHDN